MSLFSSNLQYGLVSESLNLFLNKFICWSVNGLEDRLKTLGIVFTLSSPFDCSPGIKYAFSIHWHYIRFIAYPVQGTRIESSLFCSRVFPSKIRCGFCFYYGDHFGNLFHFQISHRYQYLQLGRMFSLLACNDQKASVSHSVVSILVTCFEFKTVHNSLLYFIRLLFHSQRIEF